MNTTVLYHGLIEFIGFIAFVALHEFAHAWVATRCGDDTPRLQGRVTLDPTAHIDLMGTIILPLAMVFWGAASGRQMMFGWGRPVQVDLNQFGHRRRDDILVSAAGPAMNLLIAFALFVVMWMLDRLGVSVGQLNLVLDLARLSIFLCFFNLLPVPPLDGGHIIRNLVGIGDEAYMAISQYSFLFLVLIMRAPGVGDFLAVVTESCVSILAWVFGFQLTTP